MTPSASDAVPLPAVCSGTVGRLMRIPRVPHSFRPVSRCISWLVLLLAFFTGPSVQLDAVKNFCRRFGHQTAVIDRKLYIDGGFINYNSLSQYPTNYTNWDLHYHDLDTPGDAQMPQLYVNPTKNRTIPSVHGGTLWADNLNKRFYLFGGEYYQQPPAQQFTLWSFDTIYNRWESFDSPERDDIGAISYGAGASVSETGQGYYYGGWKSNNTVPGWTGPPLAQSGMVKYSMDSNKLSRDDGPDSVGRAEGAMVFIPVGDGGMLVYFGGVQDPYGNGSWVGQPMESVFLFDVLSSKWYTQNTTGTTPPMRRRFCAGATWALDQSSYNIYLYGGLGMPPDARGFDDVYVLTIPSFQWIKMHPPDNNSTGDYGHHSLSCNVIDNAQMLVIGGTFPSSDKCDVPDQYGVHNMDMGLQNAEKVLWKIFVTNITQYAVPDPIIAAIGGSADGGATKTAPDSGFNSADLRVLMTRKAHIPSRTPTRPPTPTGTPGPDKPLSTGAIAGIAIGGAVAAISLFLAITILIRRRRRRRQLPHTQSQPKQHLPTSPHNWTPNGAISTTYTPNSPHPHSPFLSQYHHQHGNGYLPPSQPTQPIELPVGSPQPPPFAPGVTSWLGPDGVLYELLPSPHSGSAAVSSATGFNGSGHGHGPGPGSSSSATAVGGIGGLGGGGGGGGGYDSGMATGTGTSNSAGSGGGGGQPMPQTKVDAEGRVWVQVSSSLDLPPPRSARSEGSMPAGRPSLKITGGGSPGGFGSGLGRYYSGGGGGGGGEGGELVTPGFGVDRQILGDGGRVFEPQELSCEPRGEGRLGEESGWDAAHGRPRHLTFYHP